MHRRMRVTLWLCLLGSPLLSLAQPPREAGREAGGVTVRLTWTAPASNADGSPLSPLSGYRLYQGTQPQGYGPPSALPPEATTTTVRDLQPGTTYYFALTAVSSAGESAKSNEMAAPIPARPTETGLRVNIQDYGAQPDDAVDDAPAIRAAISAVIAAGGGTVVIPPGRLAYPRRPGPRAAPRGQRGGPDRPAGVCADTDRRSEYGDALDGRRRRAMDSVRSRHGADPHGPRDRLVSGPPRPHAVWPACL